MRERYLGFSKEMGRLIVADVPEMVIDGGAFDSLQWEKPIACDDFRGTTRTGAAVDASETTSCQSRPRR